MRNFLKRKDGNMAVTFALTALPVLGGVGIAIDYARAVNVASFVQSQADIAALSGAQLGPDGNPQVYLDYLKFVTEQRYGKGDWIDKMTIDAKWLSDVDYRITVKGEVPVTILGAVPGFPREMDIGVSSIVRIAAPREVYKPPVVSELDNEAGDYNRVYVYCFDPEKAKAGKGKNKRANARSDMTAIADNAGTKYNYVMPRCADGQNLSYKLLNVRLVRGEPKKWDDPNQTRFEYYTDTEVKKGTYDYYLDNKEVLETVICNSVNECRPRSKGGIIPEGKNRDPVQAKGTCSAGKYLYYGWEDRPPGLSGPDDDWTDIAWTDRDYDDIRIVIGCPTLETVQERQVRLTR
jgi:hypothetical protein